MPKKSGHIDWYILLAVFALMLFSIAFVYSASSHYAFEKFGSREALFTNHLIRIIAGIIVLIICAKINYQVWAKVSRIIIIVAIGLLIAVLIAGVQEKGASRWINLGFLRFQPSELAKLALVLHLAVLLNKHKDYIKKFKEGLLPLLLWTGLAAFLIVMQPNHSAAFVVLFIAISMMFVGNVNILHLIAMSIVGAGGLTLYAITSKYPVERVSAFLGISDVPRDMDVYNYQLQQSLIALGNGGFWGLGPGLSRQSNLFLPESYGDFIFSIIGEEYGFIGTILIILLFLLIFWRGMVIARKAPDDFGYYLAVGIIVTIAISAFVNAGVNTGLLPTTGLPMPFVSYGGTAVIFYSAAIGVLLNISAQAGVYPKAVELEQ